jgi:carboxymethylenebutenolidase
MTTVARSTFIGGSATLLAGSSALSAEAQTTEFGKQHAPIVPDTDPAITTATVSLVRPDATISGYAAMPKTITPTTPGIVMSPHIWGVDAQYRDMARRWAKLGYIAICVGIFDRANPPNGDYSTDMQLRMPSVTALYAGNKMTGDLLAGQAWIRSKAPKAKVGLYGNCMSGGIALQAVAGDPTNYAALCELYGYVRTDRKMTQPPPADAFDYASTITIPTLGFYAGADTGISVDDAKAAFAKIKGPHEIYIYPDAPHGFLDDTRGSYRPGPATDAWDKMVAWYGKYLKTP